MKYSIVVACALLAMAACSNPGADAPAPKMGPNENAPPELSHMQNMIGDWAIADQVRQQDGSWADGPGADWDFYYTLDGYAIEDIWVKPARATPVDDEAQRVVGVNIRKYDPEAEQWVMAWLTKAPGGVQTFSATSDEEKVVMRNDVTPPQGQMRRITFYNMTGENFDWRLELSSDGEAWTEVYRIHGTRKR